LPNCATDYEAMTARALGGLQGLRRLVRGSQQRDARRGRARTDDKVEALRTPVHRARQRLRPLLLRQVRRLAALPKTERDAALALYAAA
jgi:hypothetical protein